MDFKIPDIAQGKVIPPNIELYIAKSEQERKEAKRRDRIAIYTLIFSAITMIVSIIALFIK